MRARAGELDGQREREKRSECVCTRRVSKRLDRLLATETKPRRIPVIDPEARNIGEEKHEQYLSRVSSTRPYPVTLGHRVQGEENLFERVRPGKTARVFRYARVGETL